MSLCKLKNGIVHAKGFWNEFVHENLCDRTGVLPSSAVCQLCTVSIPKAIFPKQIKRKIQCKLKLNV